MKLCILDVASIGEDLSCIPFTEFGELMVCKRNIPELLSERIRDKDILILNKVRLGEAELSEAPNVKLICVTATGFDNIDVDYCRKRGIAVCNVVGYSTNCVAQLTLAMALSLVTNLPQFNRIVTSGDYTLQGNPNCLTPVFHEIAGKTWGIVGFGNIGQAVARVAEALGCKILVNKRTPIENYKCVGLDTLCRESDIISIHTPLNADTYHLINEKRISRMKPTAIVLNVARGAVADEEALAAAIKEGRLGGLGVDVYSKEPMAKDHPFQAILDFPNVCLTPHMAWGGYETRVRLLEEVVENIRAFLAGERRNRVD